MRLVNSSLTLFFSNRQKMADDRTSPGFGLKFSSSRGPRLATTGAITIPDWIETYEQIFNSNLPQIFNVLKVFTEIPAHFYFIYLYKESLGILGRWSDQIINTELLQCHIIIFHHYLSTKQ